MNKSKITKRVLPVSLAAIGVLGVITFTGCQAKNVSETGKNIVKTDTAQNADNQAREYDVILDERGEEAAYHYAEDDLCLVDTVSGNKVTLGMSKDEIESICDEPVRTDRNTIIYDGIVVTYKDDKAVSLSVSNGIFEGDSATRYKTSRGIAVGMSHDDFFKAYGSDYVQGSDGSEDELIKTPSHATRYFKKNGKKYEFLGTSLTKEQERAVDESCYIQDFMFSNETGNIATLRVGLYSEI